jgi:hypothetical protein
MRNRVFVLAVLSLATMGITGGVAAAAPGPTPNGLIGACNMANTNALPGMFNAMSLNNVNGNVGMNGAVSHTGGIC